MKMKKILKPTRFKVILFLLLIFPSWCLIVFVTGALLNLPLSASILIPAVVLSYGLSTAVDYFVKSKKAKIGVASVIAGISVVAAYLIYKVKSQTVTVCDPVHRPTECEVRCRGIYKNASNITSEVRRKFEECMTNCTKNFYSE